MSNQNNQLSKIIVLPKREKTENEVKLAKQIKTFTRVLTRISNAGKLVGESDLACLLMIELQSLMHYCYITGREEQNGKTH